MRVGKAAVAWLLVLGGCAATNPSVPIVDAMPPGGAWAELALMVVGPDSDNDKRRACVNQARLAGVRLVERAPAAATLYLARDGNRVAFADGRPERMLGKWTAPAVCRVAIAAALRMDERVRTSNGGEPPGCRILGSVEGQDQGYAAFFAFGIGSYEAALAALQFNALRLGANFVSVDAVRQIGLLTALNGRAYACGAMQPPTAQPTSNPQI